MKILNAFKIAYRGVSIRPEKILIYNWPSRHEIDFVGINGQLKENHPPISDDFLVAIFKIKWK